MHSLYNWSISATEVQKMVEQIVKTPVLSDTKIGGVTAQKSDIFYQNRFFSDFAKNVIIKESEDVFKNMVDDKDPKHGVWQGEFWGKQMLSAAEIYKYTKDEEFKEFLRSSAKRVISYAREDGYIGSYRDSKNMKLDKSIKDASCWNVWGRKYTLWGLLAVYEITGDKDILEGAKRHASQLIDELESEGIDICDTGTFEGMPSCSILKPMVILYTCTGDKKYLDFAINKIANSWEREDGKAPNLIKNALSGKRVAQWYPDPKFWAKAYEMMSCFEGIIELYRVTGEKKYFDAVKSFVDSISIHEKNILGSVAYNDMFNKARYAMNTLSEPCDSIHYMRLCHELYMLTGEIKYMHHFESCYFNAFMAGLYPDWSSRAVRSGGRHMWTHQAGMLHQHCCLNNMARGLLRYAQDAVVILDDFITVNFYEEFFARLEYDGGECEICISGGFFENKPVKITTSFKGEAKKIRLRVPHWCDLFSCDKDGIVCDGYYVPEACGNIELFVSFDMKVKFNEFEGTFCDNEWHLDRFTSDYAKVCTIPHELFLTEKKCTLTYGPLLLAKSKKIGCTEDEVFDSPAVTANSKVSLTLSKADDTYACFVAHIDNGNEKFDVKVCDFASCANDRLEDDRYFSIYF